MSTLGRWSAVAAIVLGGITALAWDSGDEPVAAGIQTDGAQLFHAKGCATCHAGPGDTDTISGFPPLTGAADWAGTRRAGLSAEEYLAESIAAPDAFISPAFQGGQGLTGGMPTLHVTPAEIGALVAFLLESTAADP